MAKNKMIYVCTKCAYESAKWMGQCPSCKEWNCFEEREVREQTGPVRLSSDYARPAVGNGLKQLNTVSTLNSERLQTCIDELDRVLGGGLTKDSISIIAAKPGAGKSTLLLQMAEKLAENGHRVLYVSGEESEGQLKRRAERILKSISENIWVIASVSLNEALSAADRVKPELLIIDSIQTFSLGEFTSRPGTPTQVVECTNALIRLAKDPEHPLAVFMAGQLTKDDELAGVRTLEHMVDTVLYMEAEPGEELRVLSATKNRFGSTGEMGFFIMEEHGLEAIENPSEFFMTRRTDGELVSGTALTVLKEGTRPLIAEVESLVSRSFTPYPARIAECMKRDLLGTLISVLEQRGGISLYDKNVVVKTAGGLKLTQPSANLATIVSLVSSATRKPVPNGTVFIGDVGLTGELKRVPSMDTMVRELDRMKFDRVFLPHDALRPETLKKLTHIKVTQAKSLQAVLQAVFGTIQADNGQTE